MKSEPILLGLAALAVFAALAFGVGLLVRNDHDDPQQASQEAERQAFIAERYPVVITVPSSALKK